VELEFRRTVLPEDGAELWMMDVEIFGPDAFTPEDWLNLESYWVVADGRMAGSVAFIQNVDFGEDLGEGEQNVAERGTLYIQSTGLLREFRGRGLGKRVKEWQIEYAKNNGFSRVVTNCRESNAAMIKINERFGFRVVRKTDDYYGDGEATVVMELELA
jgi:ribosomal protein S18 acetylase RimI-like enzyme